MLERWNILAIFFPPTGNRPSSGRQSVLCRPTTVRPRIYRACTIRYEKSFASNTAGADGKKVTRSMTSYLILDERTNLPLFTLPHFPPFFSPRIRYHRKNDELC